MLRALLDQQRPPYLRCHADHFLLAAEALDTLDARVHSLQPVRKRFAGQRLVCWSPDGQTGGRPPQPCAFCPHTRHCQARVRLNLILTRSDHPDLPAILELRPADFPAVEAALAAAGPDPLNRVLFRFRLVPASDGYHRLAVTALF